MLKRKLVIIKIFMIIGVVAGVAGSGDSSSTPPPPTTLTIGQQIAALEANGTLPTLDRTNTLGGIDANNNDIRDDIERWIASQPITNDKKRALSQFAKSMQESILVDASNSAMVLAVSARESAAIKCINRLGADRVNGVNTISAIEKYMANTKTRVVAYLKYANALNGTIFESPLGEGCAH